MSRTGSLIFAKRMPLATTCALALLAGGCSLTSSTGTLSPASPLQPGESEAPFCLVGKPISYSLKQDTPETVEQVQEHNAVGKALACQRWGKAP